MSRTIPESDWRVFREVRAAALERFCTQILAEATREIANPGKSSHEKYLSLYKLIERHDHDIARAFNNPRRSTACMQMRVMHSMGLFTEVEVQRFSPEIQEGLAFYGQNRNA
jgi:hypothetical protein